MNCGRTTYEVKIAFERSADTSFNEVRFELEEVVLNVTKDLSDPDILYAFKVIDEGLLLCDNQDLWR